MLEVTGLAKSYPTPRGALDILSGVDLALRAGEAASIVGPSGSGKSTLLYVLGALEPPTAGTVTLDGVDPFTLAPAELAAFRNRRVGFVFQDHLLLPQCTVLENVLIPTLVGDGVDGAGDRARELLGRAGLGDRLDHRPGELSGGERQRVALARALIRRPPLLLCDEPTGNLDRAAGEVVADMLFDLHGRQETVLVVVTHNVELAARCPIRYRLEGLGLKRMDGGEERSAGDAKRTDGGVERMTAPRGDRASRFVGSMSDFRLVGVYNSETGRVDPVTSTPAGEPSPPEANSPAREAFVRRRAAQLALEDGGERRTDGGERPVDGDAKGSGGGEKPVDGGEERAGGGETTGSEGP